MSDQVTERKQLRRQLGLRSATILVIANMIGSGVFTTSGFIIGELGSGQTLLWCWLVGGLFALAGALCYGELGAMFPHAGGEYRYLREAFGPAPAFLSGWVSLIVGFSAPIAAAAIAFATYFLGGSAAPWFVLTVAGSNWLTLSPVTALAIGAVLALSLVHLHSLRLGEGVQNLLTFYKLALIVLFVVVGLGLGDGEMAHFSQPIADAPGGTGSFAVALIFVSFAYSGWNAAAYLGEEIRRPERNLPLSLLFGTLLVSALYLCINLVYVYALPPQMMQGKLEIGIAAAKAMFGNEVGDIFGVAIAFGLLSVMSAMIMAGPRVSFAMARDGLFPRRFADVHQKRLTPAASILFQTGLVIVMILAAAYDTLLIYIGFTLSISSMLTVAGLMRLRKLTPELSQSYRTVGYPLTPLVFIAGNLAIVGYTLVSQPLVGLYGGGTLAVGAGFYFVMQAGKHRALCENSG